MIYTLTLNPAIDYFLGYKEKPQGVQKTSNFKYIPGGKGINASIVLKNLGLENKAIILSSGFTGKKLELLLSENNIDYINIDTGVDTRVNVKANFAGDTIEQNSAGEKIDAKHAIDSFKKISDEYFKEDDTLMIMGSLPPGLEFEDLETLVKYAKNKGVKLIFDLSRDHLSKLVKYKPEIIKPNVVELSELFNVKISTKGQAMKYARKLKCLGAKRVLVSFDKTGSIYFDGEEKYIDGVEIQEINGSGAGDSMIAAFAYGLEKNLNTDELLQLASGAGTATAASEGIADINKINFYKEKIKVKGGENV